MPQPSPAPRPVPGHPPFPEGHPPFPEPRPDPRAGGPEARPAPRPDVPNGRNPGGPFPPPRPPGPGNPGGGGSRGSDDVTVSTEQAAPPRGDLSMNKVLAGAGAAATTAVLGSFFGAEGTVVGAAFGSVASTLATSLYQRSLDRTRDTLVARVRVRRAGSGGADDPSDSEMTVRLPPVGPDGAVQPDVDERPARRRRWLIGVGLAALAFAIAMVVITGIELAKGSTITGNESGTSIGRAAEPKPAAPAEDEESDPAETDTTTTPEPTDDPESSVTETPDPDAPGGAEGGSSTQDDDERAPEDDPDGSDDVAPTEEDAPGDTPATPDAEERTGSGGGAASRFGAGFADRFGAKSEPAAAPTTAAAPTGR